MLDLGFLAQPKPVLVPLVIVPVDANVFSAFHPAALLQLASLRIDNLVDLLLGLGRLKLDKLSLRKVFEVRRILKLGLQSRTILHNHVRDP